MSNTLKDTEVGYVGTVTEPWDLLGTTATPEYYAGMLPEVKVTAPITEEAYSRYWRNRRKREERRQQREMNAAIRKGTDKAGKIIGTTMIGLASIPVAKGMMAGMNAFQAAFPKTATVVDLIGAADGIKNFFSDNGVQKTYRKLKEGDLKGAGVSAVGDAFDLLGASELARVGYKISQPLYRAGHAYVNVSPVGYHTPFKRGMAVATDWLSGKDPNLNVKKWEGQPRIKQSYEYLTESFPNDYDYEGAKEIAMYARDDAWRKYLRLPEQHNIYLRNPDGTFSYNLKLIDEKANHQFRPDLTDTHGDFQQPGNISQDNGFDFVTGAGGGLTGNTSRLLSIDPDGTKHGIQTIEDVWDLHPFSRHNDLISTKLINKYQDYDKRIRDKAQDFRVYMYDNGHWGLYDTQNTLLGKMTSWMDRPLNIFRMGQSKMIPKLQNSKVLKSLDNAVSKFEVGPLLGGKPFTMRTDIPIRVNPPKKIHVTDSDINPILKMIMEEHEETSRVVPGTVSLELKHGGKLNYLNYIN